MQVSDGAGRMGNSIALQGLLRLTVLTGRDLELTRLKVHDSNIHHDLAQARHEGQVLRVLLEIVLAIFFVLKLRNKAMRKGSL